MASEPTRAQRLIAVMHRDAFAHLGQVEQEFDGGQLLMFRPWLNDPGIAYKGMRQPLLFARHFVRDDLPRRWREAWQQFQGQARPIDSSMWDVDHVFPFCWAEARGFNYVLLTPVMRRPNRSAGAGIERTAALPQNLALLDRCVEVNGPYAYVTATGIAKLMNVTPGPGREAYPGLLEIAPHLEHLKALLGF